MGEIAIDSGVTVVGLVLTYGISDCGRGMFREAGPVESACGVSATSESIGVVGSTWHPIRPLTRATSLLVLNRGPEIGQCYSSIR